MAQVPAEGPEILLVMSEEVLPSWSFGGILRENLYAGLLGGLCAMLFILFLKHQDGKLVCETTVNAEPKIRCELEDLMDINLNLKKEVEEAQEKNCDLLENKAQMTIQEDALLERIQDLETPLVNDENSHAEEIVDLTQEAERKIQEAEDTIQVLEKESKVLKKIQDKTEDLINNQGEETDYLNCLNTANNILQERLNECAAQKEKTLKLEGDLECHVNESRNLMEMKPADEEQEKEGKLFLRIVDEEITKLQDLINSAESDLKTFRPQMSEEVQGKVLAAMGKARLLITQKVEQFRGLCQQNIDGPKGEEPTIMAADLAGFWDMVSIQVANVHHLFKEVSVLKTNGWKQDQNAETTNNVTIGPVKRKPAKVIKRAMKTCPEEQKARDEARKKLLEEKRRAMKEAMKAKQTEPDTNGVVNDVEIILAENKTAHLQNSTGEKEDKIAKSNEGGEVNEKIKEVEKQKEGHQFLQIVENEVSGLQALINNAESDLKAFTPEMSEEVQGKVLAATGKARLLISQKIEQFRGLCQQNIDGPKGEEPAILAEDLAGFWDMVSIQVDNVHQLFKEVSVLKANGWKENSNTQNTNNVTKGPAKREPVKVMKKAVKNCSEEQKARDEARRKLLEERRRAMKEALKAKPAQPDANGIVDDVEIMLAEKNIAHLQNLAGEDKEKRTKGDEGGTVNEKTKEVEKQMEGHQFLQIVENEVSGLQALIDNAESDLEAFTPQMSEEVQGKVLAATGKARLLISQKIEQFRGLCQQNIDGPKGEEPVILAEDLAGFWDMVSIQVDNVHHLFKEVSVLKANGWKENPNTQNTNNVTKGPVKREPVKVMKKGMKNCSEERKARDEARKKLLEERRRAMKEALKAKQTQPDANGSTDGVEILVTEKSMTHLQENLKGI
ncbi:myosin-3-like [Macrobrachium nipponense]|uniref:myosin-3-like n=1 Tax=Macrobrachium nipponense TaxID=159736 RepID=UPI0030C7C9B6